MLPHAVSSVFNMGNDTVQALNLGTDTEPVRLPPLREDIKLYRGPGALDGSPTWTLHDPVRNQFFRIGWIEFEILARWHLGDAQKLIDKTNTETTINVNQSHVESVITFLSRNQLLEIKGESAIEMLLNIAKTAKKSTSAWLLHNYLFFKVPVTRPDKFLSRTYPMIAPLFSRRFLVLLMAMTFLGLYLVFRQWESFTNTFLYFFSLDGLVLFAIVIIFAKVIHELGHAYTAKRYGLKVPTMGIAFLVMWPVLYTDTTDAWKLPLRRQRLAIGAAGMTAEIALAAIATLLWSFLPDGAVKSAAFMVATTTWVLTLLVNINPFMRFDGYYLLSDYLEIQNMQDRAFNLAKWQMRELFFGLRLACPEKLPRHIHNILLIYAYLTWIYRFFLFIGIALIVYFFFFKLAGIILMAAEIGWFIARPVYREVSEWLKLRDAMQWNMHTKLTAGLVTLGVILIIFPWSSHVESPALLKAKEHAVIYSPLPGQIIKVTATNEQPVMKGDLLFSLVSPDINQRARLAAIEANILQNQLSRQPAHSIYLEQSRVLQEKLQATIAEYHGHMERLSQLDIRSPIDGVITQIPDSLREKRWINESEALAIIINRSDIEIEAYFSEENIARIGEGTTGSFYPENPNLPVLDVIVKQMDQSNSRVLQEPYLASIYSGDIAVRHSQTGQIIPNESIFRVVLALDETEIDAPAQISRGTVVLSGEGQSILSRVWKQTGAVLVRESGF